MNNQTNFQEALENIDFIIHLAGRAHLFTTADDETQAHEEFLTVNFYGTKNLAQQAAQKGVKMGLTLFKQTRTLSGNKFSGSSTWYEFGGKVNAVYNVTISNNGRSFEEIRRGNMDR